MARTVCAALCLALWACAVRANYRRPFFVWDRTPPELWMNTPDLVSSRGYPVEAHEVQTTDGYLLTLYRLPRGRDKYAANHTARRAASAASHGTPVLFSHGLASSSEQWVLRERDNAVFELADRGFDVWLGAFRGSYYGRKHVSLLTDSPEFWDFSWHENALFDQAATIDYILATTKQAALCTVGHSMGSTVQVVLLSEKPEYAKKVKASVLMAPPIYFEHMPGLPGFFATAMRAKPSLKVASGNVVPNGEILFLRVPFYVECLFAAGGSLSGPTLPPACMAINEIVAGPAHRPIDVEQQKLLAAHFPAGAAIRQSLHYAQIQSSGQFQKYDFGSTKNMLLYKLENPPLYNLSRIKTPLYIYYSMTDNLVHYKDAETFASQVPSVKQLYRIPQEEFNHNDYFVSTTVAEDVTAHLIKDLSNHID